MDSSIFEYKDYRLYLKTWVQSQRASGHGTKTKMAEALGVSSALVSQIFKGEKNLSAEQAVEATEFLGLNESETEYFLLLVELARAGSFKLESRLEAKRLKLQSAAKKIDNRVRKDVELNAEQKAEFYSSWLYQAIRSLSALEKFTGAQDIAKRLSLPNATVIPILEFLKDNGLVRTEKGKLTYGPAFTHISADSPLVNKHHQNWRIQAMKAMDSRNHEHLFYTAPMSLSAEAVSVVRKELLASIDRVLKVVGPSKSEQVYCLNIDWFDF